MRDLTSLPLPARVALAALALSLAAACGASHEPAATPAGPAIRMGYGSGADFGDSAADLAHEQLRAQGYVVDTPQFPSTEAALEALVRGDIEFAAGSTRSAWAAIARGAPLRTVFEQSGNLFALVSTNDRAGCAAVDGRTVALHGEGAAGTAMARAWLAEHCPQARPHTIMVPASANRMAALLSGSVQAAVIKVSDHALLEERAPGRFVLLTSFAREYPGLVVAGVYVNTRYAAAHPTVVRDYLRARLAANRAALASADAVVASATRVLGANPLWPGIAREYIAQRAWDPNGGLTPDRVATTLAFMAQRAGLDASLTVDRVADFTYLTDAFASEGRATSSPLAAP